MNRRPALTLIETLVVLTLIGVLIALTLGGVQRVRSSAARASCQNRLRQVGLGLANYHSAHGHLPVGVTPKTDLDAFELMGWQARILPHIEQDAVWRQVLDAVKTHPYDFTVSPPHPFSTCVPAFTCPADERTQHPQLARGKLTVALGSYLGVAGTRNSRRDGMLFYGKSARFGDVADGASNTLMVGERPPSPDLWLGWWYAGYGVDFRGTADTVLGVRERNSITDPYFPDCGPGSSHFKEGRFDSMCDVMHFWSPHSGGANFAFADGSVRFLTYSADPIMPALATRAGGESVELP